MGETLQTQNLHANLYFSESERVTSERMFRGRLFNSGQFW